MTEQVSLSKHVEKVNITDSIESTNFAEGTDELDASEKAKYKLTGWVFGTCIILLLISGLVHSFYNGHLPSLAKDILKLCAHDNLEEIKNFCTTHGNMDISSAKEGAKDFFEFCKNFVPPIITLVLGAHYVNKSNETDS